MTEIPERYLSQAYEDKVDDLVSDMKQGENAEWLWQEIERMLASKDTKDRDGLEDLSISDLITRVCEEKAEQMLDDGLLDDAARDLAVGDAEDRSDYFRDR